MESQMKDMKEERQIKQNLLQLCFGFFFVISVYSGIEPLQGSLNPDQGLGTTTTAIIYATAVLSSLFVAAPVLNTIGPKRGILSLFLAHTVYCLANFHPSWWTLVPASALVGFAATMGWGGQGIYMMSLAERYGSLTNQSTDTVLSFFTGIFFVFIGLTRPLGNLISSVVLQEVVHSYTVIYNTTGIVDTEISYLINGNQSAANENNQSDPNFQICGANHCPYLEQHQTLLLKPDKTLIFILMGIYLAFNLTGVTITALLPNVLPNQAKKQSALDKYKQVAGLFKEPKLLLMICSYLASGMVRAMNIGSFTQSFVSCTLGTGMVGYAMMCDGFGYASVSLITGRLTKYIPRIFHIITVSLMNIAIAVVWLLWQPSPDKSWMLFVLATIQGSTNAIWKVHTMALTGIMFTNTLEAGYAHVMIWDCLGHVMVFGYNNFLCFHIKTYIFLGVLGCSLISYPCLERFLRNTHKRESGHVQSKEFEMQKEAFLEKNTTTT